MKLRDYLKERGKTAYLAQLIGIAPSAISFWAKGHRQIPAEHCPKIEKATNHAVTCEELRPDIDWAVLRSSKGLPHD